MIETERLILRPWQDDDRAPFHAMCRDPQVMATLGPLLTRGESDALIDRMIAMQADLGHCFWAMERQADGMFTGFCGLKPGAENTPVAGGVEIGWRLASDQWGKGYAREAAAASVRWAWSQLDADAVLAITAQINRRSWGLMERLGMRRIAGADFDHPLVPVGSDLRRHVTYRLDRPA